MKNYLIFDRLLALIYDLIFLGLSLLIIILGFNYLNHRFFGIEGSIKTIVLSLILIILYLIEFTLIPLVLKGTIGKYLTELKIESTYGKVTFGRLLFREFFLKHLIYITGLGFLIECIFFIIKKQTIHDFLLKTSVVKKEI